MQDFAKVHYKLENYLNVTSLISFPLLLNPINTAKLVSSLVKLNPRKSLSALIFRFYFNVIVKIKTNIPFLLFRVIQYQ